MFTWNVLYDTNAWHVQNCWNSEMFEMAKWSKRLKRWEWLKKVEKIQVFEMVIMLKWSKWCCSSFQFNLAETATSWQTKKSKSKCRQQVQNHFLSEQVFWVLKRKRWKVGSLKDFPLVIIFFIKCKWLIEANKKYVSFRIIVRIFNCFWNDFNIIVVFGWNVFYLLLY